MKKLIAFTLMIIFSGMVSAANQVLCDEVSIDPLGRGYSGMTSQQVADDLTTNYRTAWLSCVDGSALLDAIDAADWVSVTDAQQSQALSILAIGCLNPQGNARTLMIGIFGSGSQTIVNMAAVAQEPISRAAELGLSKVRAGDVESCQ